MAGWRVTLNKIVEWFLVILMLLLVGDVLLQVISRYLLENAISFTDELAGFLLMWVALAGAAYVTGRGEHLAISLMIEKVSARQKTVLAMVIDLLILFFAILVLVIGGIWLVYTRFYLGQVSASLEIPLGYVYLILPLSGLLMCVYILDDLISKLRSA